MKISVIGMGAVGTAIVGSLVHMAEVHEIVAVIQVEGERYPDRLQAIVGRRSARPVRLMLELPRHQDGRH